MPPIPLPPLNLNMNASNDVRSGADQRGASWGGFGDMTVYGKGSGVPPWLIVVAMLGAVYLMKGR